MERMNDYKKEFDLACEKIVRLEKENKKLKECNKSQSEVINNVFIPQKERLEEENKKLKIEIGGVMGERDGKQMRIEELEEENKKLKEENETLAADNQRFRARLDMLGEKE